MRAASFSRLGSPAWGARSASTSGAIPWMKSCAINPVAKTQRPAFMPCANLTLPGPSSTGSSGSAVRNGLLVVIGALRLILHLSVILAGNLSCQAIEHRRQIAFHVARVYRQHAIPAFLQPPTAVVAAP